MNALTLRKILYSCDVDGKINILSHLCDVFESYTAKIDNFQEIMNELIVYAISENKIELQEEILHTLSIAAANRDISKIDFALLVKNLNNFSINCLPEAIDVIGFTHNENYVKVLKPFLNHHDNRVVYSAHIAISEIENVTGG
jgi:hypothetical protein